MSRPGKSSSLLHFICIIPAFIASTGLLKAHNELKKLPPDLISALGDGNALRQGVLLGAVAVRLTSPIPTRMNLYPNSPNCSTRRKY